METAAQWALMVQKYFPHFSSEAVYAGLLFKTGNQQKAIEFMLKASEDPILKSNADMQKLLLENVKKMEKGVSSPKIVEVIALIVEVILEETIEN